MTKRITSLFLVLALCLTFFPVMASAEEGETTEEPTKTVVKVEIKTVKDLQDFAKAVNDEEYDEDTDLIVSLDADLDLSNSSWTPIAGQVIQGENGAYVACFSGKFYGNGHTISGVDFSSLYGQEDYVGFFGAIENAEIYDLTIQGKVDVTLPDNGNMSFGSITGLAADSTISNCISEVSFQNNGKYIYGTIGMCGKAYGVDIEYCRNDGDITITGDMGSLYVGGIAGYVGDTSEINYCANTGDMTVNAPQAGGIVGQLSGNATMTNCYSIGKLTPIGKGTEDIGGIVGTVGSNSGTNNTISHCYFGGEIDLSNYTATLPYSRFGGIVGQRTIAKKDDVDLALATFENNFFAEKENVSACGKNLEGVGTAKSLEYMQTEDFYKEITAGGGNYRYEEDSTPLLPKPTHEVSFVVTPAELTDVVITVDGKKATNPAALENGTHKFTVTAKDCETFSGEFTVSANPETHTQTVAMSYLPADYTAVDVAIEKAKALNESDYRNFDTVKTAVEAVIRGKNITQQADVDAMAKAIEDAITGLVRKSSGSSSSGSGNTTTKTETTTNPDGSTTKTETKKDGSVTETTTGTDGSVTKTESKTDTKSDGSKTETKTETKTDADGNKTTSKTETTTDKSGTVTESKTETKTDADGTKTEVKSETKKDQNDVTTGTETVKETLPNGSTGTTTTTTDANGTKTEAVTTISSKAVDEAKKNDEAVTVPVDVKATEDSQTAPTVKVELPKNSGETKVEIPVSNVTPGTVVAVVKPDGTEEIVKDCIPTENGIQLTVEDNVTLKVFDNAKDFTDTTGHWAEPYIDFASARELLNGISEDTFAPEQPTTRAMMWTVLARQDDTDLSGGTTWYDKAQAWAKDSGVSDGTAPQANVTRAQMVTMLWRAAGSPAPQTMSSFADVSADAYYAAAVAWAAEQGITNGVSATQFQPNGACTRAQIAAFLYRASLEN